MTTLSPARQARRRDLAVKLRRVLDAEGRVGLVKLAWRAVSHRVQVEIAQRGVASDARRDIARLAGGRGLFIDCGSNLGQGFAYFSRHFTLDAYDYVLIEPNPNCLPDLHRVRDETPGEIEVIGEAAGVGAGEVRFYGLTEDSRGSTSDGGSILRDHNSARYDADEDRAIVVRTFSLADYIRSRRPDYASVVVKMDIEGAEYDVLEDLIASGAHKLIDLIYVEFHSQNMLEPRRTAYRRRQQRITGAFKRDGAPFRVWV